jgi:hypothetical protein
MKYGRLDATNNYTKKSGRITSEDTKYDYDDNFYDLQDSFLDDEDMKNVNVNMIIPETYFKDYVCLEGDFMRLMRSKYFKMRI